MISMTVYGNVGSDPKLATTQGGKSTLRFSVASNSGKKDEQEPTWVRVTVWGAQAESLQHLIAKGKRVLVVGPAKLREWQGEKGKQTDLELDARDVQIVDYPERDGDARERPPAQRAAPPPSNPGPALPPGVPAGSALHPATGTPTHYCQPGGTAWTPIPPPAMNGPGLPPPPAPTQARAPF
jgi:single stranded DNA-binding protein